MSDKMKFFLVTAFFSLSFIVMTVFKVKSFWGWTAFIVMWTWAEIHFAKNIHLKYWHWALIILGLSALDIIILYFLG